MNRNTRQTAARITGPACAVTTFIAGACGLIAVVSSYPVLAPLVVIAAVMTAATITLLAHQLSGFSSKQETLVFLLGMTAGLLTLGLFLTAPPAFYTFIAILLIISTAHLILRKTQAPVTN